MTTDDYPARTEANVVDSDATVVFTKGRPAGGSRLTIEFAMKHRKPWVHFSIDQMTRKKIAADLTAWLSGRGSYDFEDYQAQPPAECVLNVAGSRESKCPGIEALVHKILIDVLRKVIPECAKFYPLG